MVNVDRRGHIFDAQFNDLVAWTYDEMLNTVKRILDLLYGIGWKVVCPGLDHVAES